MNRNDLAKLVTRYGYSPMLEVDGEDRWWLSHRDWIRVSWLGATERAYITDTRCMHTIFETDDIAALTERLDYYNRPSVRDIRTPFDDWADKAHAYSAIQQMHNDVLSILFRLETLMNKKEARNATA